MRKLPIFLLLMIISLSSNSFININREDATRDSKKLPAGNYKGKFAYYFNPEEAVYIRVYAIDTTVVEGSFLPGGPYYPATGNYRASATGYVTDFSMTVGGYTYNYTGLLVP